MSSIDEARAIRFLIDSLNDSVDADLMFSNGRYASALSHADQSCEKATKACLAIMGIIGKKDHIISRHVREEIMPATASLKDRFKSYLRFLTDIETYYIPARYGVDLYGRISLDQYEGSNVEKLVQTSKEYVGICFLFVEEQSGKNLPGTAEKLTDYLKAIIPGSSRNSPAVYP